jgi:hypothetical protein
MAAFLKVDDLRAHGALASSRPIFGPMAAPAEPYSASSARLVLGAHWMVAPDGRLTCQWQVDLADFDIPPD